MSGTRCPSLFQRKAHEERSAVGTHFEQDICITLSLRIKSAILTARYGGDVVSVRSWLIHSADAFVTWGGSSVFSIQ